jgi:hypothetical protein
MAFHSSARVALLAALPTVGAACGAAVDERISLGVTTWRSACRASGVSLPSILHFTWQLLPNMLLGTLLGAFVLLCLAVAWRTRGDQFDECTAAHLGCWLAMPLALVACAVSLPVSVMPLVDASLAIVTAFLLLRVVRRKQASSAAHP